MKQAADVLRLEKETAEKLAAKAFAKSYLADLVPSVFNNLRENGYFYDPVERDIETGYMPWLMQDAVDELQRQSLARLVLDSMIRDVVIKRHDEYERLAEMLKMNEQQPSATENVAGETSDPILTLNRDESILIGDEASGAAGNLEAGQQQAGEGDEAGEAGNQFDEVQFK